MVDNILNSIIRQNKKLYIQFQRVICSLLRIAYCNSITKFIDYSFHLSKYENYNFTQSEHINEELYI